MKYTITEESERNEKHYPLYALTIDTEIVLEHCLFSTVYNRATSEMVPGDTLTESHQGFSPSEQSYDAVMQDLEKTRDFLFTESAIVDEERQKNRMHFIADKTTF